MLIMWPIGATRVGGRWWWGHERASCTPIRRPSWGSCWPKDPKRSASKSIWFILLIGSWSYVVYVCSPLGFTRPLVLPAPVVEAAMLMIGVTMTMAESVRQSCLFLPSTQMPKAPTTFFTSWCLGRSIEWMPPSALPHSSETTTIAVSE